MKPTRTPRRPAGTRPPAASTRAPAAGARARKPSPGPAEPRSVRWLLVAAGGFAFAGAVLLTLYAAPELQGRHEWLAMAASFAPYGWLAWLASVILAALGARGRTRLMVAPLALGLAWHTGIVVPYLPGPDRATAAPRASLTVLELNLHWGLADLGVLAGDVRRERPDVLVLAEATQATQQALAKKPWSQDYPYLLGTAGHNYNTRTGEGDSRGTLLVSRVPLTQLGYAEGTTFTNVAARVELPGHPITLIAAHPANPEYGVGTWVQDADALTRLALPYTAGPLVLAGDLNATAEHLTLRELMAKAGLSDSAAGQGWHPTYPADEWYPPLIQIDHVLVSRQFNTVGYRTISVPGTDHRGLLVELAVS